MKRTTARLAWSLSAGCWVIAVTAMALALRNGGSVEVSNWAMMAWSGDVAGLLAIAGFATVGGLLAARRPTNPIGWLMLAGPLTAGASFLAEQVSIYGFVTKPGSIPLAGFAGWLALWLHLVMPVVLGFTLFLFPTGRLPSPRWRAVLWASLIACVGLALIEAFGAPGSQLHPEIVNPYLVTALRPAFDASLAAVWLPLIVGWLAITSLVVRYRRGSQTERQQLKWIVMAGIFLFVCSMAAFTLPLGRGAGLLVGLALLALPVAIGVAILRYRLYDIDLLIKRTVVYGGTSAAIGVVFFAGIVALQTALRPLTAGSDLAVAAATLVSFGLFQPVRRRVQDAVDRRFDRSRYDAARTLDVFADRLRDEVDLDALRDDLLGAVRQTMGPAHTSLWLRERAG